MAQTSINVRLISKQDVQKIGYAFGEIIELIEQTLIEYKKGNILFPDKISQVFDEASQNRINCMPATLLSENVCGVKWVSVFPNNPQRFNVPNVSGMIILSELEKGYPFAVLDGTLITALRTACIGALGAKWLAKTDSVVYGTIGSGEQAKMHFEAIKSVCPNLKICKVASRKEQSEERFVNELQNIHQDVQFIKCKSDYRKASLESDVIVTAVSCQKPLLYADTIKPGAFYCHVGGWEDEYEVPLKADKIVCDSWDAVKHRTQTISRLYQQGRLSDSDIYGDIADIILGKLKGRENDSEFVYFNSVGLSFIDVKVAHYFYKRACECGYGKEWQVT